MTDTSDIMALIARAPWHEAVTYRDTWPHEYVMVNRDGQQDLLAAFCTRIARGEGAEPRFLKVVYPGGWDMDNTLPPDPPISPPVQKHHDFYQPLIEKLARAGFVGSAIQYYNHAGRFFRSGFHNDMGYAASLDRQNSAWVTLHIQTEDNELTESIFDKLQADRNDIERSIYAGPSPDWQWLRHDSYFFSTINIRTAGSIDDPPEKLEQLRSWMFDTLPKFKEVFDPRVADILSELRH